MRKIWEFMRLDLRRLRGNVIALVVCVGMVVVPSFYAWFNIAGSWDPYGNTKNLKVAVANLDAGYTGELLPMSLNMGERMAASLATSESIGYDVTSEQDALEGVRSGEYYAAIVFPEDFTQNMLSVLSPSPQHPSVRFYQNEKISAIGAIVTDKASAAVQQDIDESFAQSVTNVGAGVLEELSGYLDDDEMGGFAQRLDEVAAQAQSSLGQTADSARSFAGVLASTRALLGDGTGSAGTSLEVAGGAGDALRDTAGNVRALGDAVDGATDSVNQALDQSAAGLDGVGAAIDAAFDRAGGSADEFAGGLRDAKGIVDTQVARLDALLASLEGTDTLYHEWYESWEGATDPTFGGQVAVRKDDVYRLSLTVEGLHDSVSSLRDSMAGLSEHLEATAGDVERSAADAAQAKEELQGLVAQAREGVDSVQGDYEANLKGSLRDLADKIDSAASDADTVAASVGGTLGAVGTASRSAADGVEGAQAGLLEAADALDEAADELGGMSGKLREALASGDVEQVRAVVGAGSGALAAFIAEPVSIDRTAVYPVQNNGSAMAPFYSTLAIWIGAVVLCALVRTGASERRLRELGCTPAQAYAGRLAFFAGIGFAQALLIALGNLFYLQVQCEHPGLFVLACLCASLAFVNIVFALTASFGDVGKAVAVVLMVVQVAGAGGSFPVQMLPEGFQALYPFLPFVHAENAMRAAMFGLYGADFWVELGILLSYLAPALLLGLVLRRPVIRANEWVELKLASSKVM